MTERTGVLSTARSLPRLSRILRILGRHGFFAAARGRAHWPTPPQVREALEESGVVFLKFGQVLALRRDLLPEAYVREFDKLHDRLPPMQAGDVAARITAELGRPPSEVFASFSEQPLASATIAQVHSATLTDGRSVVVKVRRLGLETTVAEDMAVLRSIAALAEKLSPRLRVLDLTAMVEEFRASLLREMDFRSEAQSIRRFRIAMADVAEVWIPDVIPEFSSQGVLTLEHSPGVRIDLYAETHAAEGAALARPVAALLLRQVFREGLFHADLHPGNLFVLPDGRLCLHDLGMIGELDEPMRMALTGLLAATVEGDARAATDAYLELGLVGPDVDRGALERDLAGLLHDIHQRPLAEVSVGNALQRLVQIGGRHRVRNPGAILLLTRAFLIVEAVLRRLDPDLSLVAVFRDELGAIAVDRYSPKHLRARAGRALRELDLLMANAPGDVRRLLRRIGDGDLGRVYAPGVERLAGRLSRDLARLAVAVASAALLIAGSMVVGMEGWRRDLGTVLLIVGILGSIGVALSAWFTGKSRM